MYSCPYHCPGLLSLVGGGRRGCALIDYIVCTHSIAMPAAGHTQWSDCAEGCQMTAARGCPLELRYVIADRRLTLENSWEHIVVILWLKKRRKRKRNVDLNFFSQGPFCAANYTDAWCSLRGISGNGMEEFLQMLTRLGQRLWTGGHGFTFSERMQILYWIRYWE